MLNAQPTFIETKAKQSRDLNAFLHDVMEPVDQRELGLINRQTYEQMIANPIINTPTTTQLVDELNEPREYLEAIQEDANEFGIEYSWALATQEDVTEDELARALDPSDLLSIKEQDTPALKRNNFWYVDKQRNDHDWYTRYLLANWGERIVTDDELQSNPWFAYQRALSDAREDGDTDLYNQLKQERKSTHDSLHLNESNADTHEQCFLKMWTKLYWDVMNVPTSLLKNINRSKPIEEKNKRQLISYLDMFQSPVKQLLKLQTKIKLVNINNKTIAIL